MDNKLKVYLAGGWFTPVTRDILENLESLLTHDPKVNLYSPRRDGIMLPPNQKHDTALRESIFKENIKNIDDADLVVANIHSTDSYNDPGTIYEVGYAMAHNIPVIGFALSKENISERFLGILDGFECIIYSYAALHNYLEDYHRPEPVSSKVLLVGSGDEEVDGKIASYVVESGSNIRWIYEDHSKVYANIDDIFKGIQYMIAVVDDRKTIVSWMIGQAYARGIPVVTYSNHGYGINVMLLVSLLTHIRGFEELQSFLQQVK